VNKRRIIIIALILAALTGAYFLFFRTYCETVGPVGSGLNSPQGVLPGMDNVNCKNYFKAFLMLFNKRPKNTERTTPTASPETKVDISGWQTYRNEKYGFEIKYPENWQADDEYENRNQPIFFKKRFSIFPYNTAQMLRISIAEKSVFEKNIQPKYGWELPRENGVGKHIGDNYFLILKDGLVIWLDYSYGKYDPTFFDQILSTFKFTN